MNSENVNNSSLNQSNSKNNYFDFYSILFDVFSFWKTILITIIITTFLVLSLYYMVENKSNIKIQIKKLNESGNIIRNTYETLQEVSFILDMTNGRTNSLSAREELKFHSEDLLQLFLTNLNLSDAKLNTSKKFSNENAKYSYWDIHNNLKMITKDGNKFIQFTAKDPEIGVNILKNLFLESEKFSKETILSTVNSKIDTLYKSIEITQNQYKQKIKEEITIVSENIALAKHMLLKAPASDELRLRSDLLLDPMISYKNFKIPLFLYGSDALELTKEILQKRLNEKKPLNEILEGKLELENIMIKIINSSNTKLLKYNLNSIDITQSKLPFYFVALFGILLGGLLGMLIAFFRASKTT